MGMGNSTMRSALLFHSHTMVNSVPYHLKGRRSKANNW